VNYAQRNTAAFQNKEDLAESQPHPPIIPQLTAA
jgi:hypothetical protein